MNGVALFKTVGAIVTSSLLRPTVTTIISKETGEIVAEEKGDKEQEATSRLGG